MTPLPSRLRSCFVWFAVLCAGVSTAFAQSAPNAPVGLSAQVLGNAARLTWSAPNGGTPATTYLIDAGTTSGASNLVSDYPLGGVLSFDTPALPPGGYFVRVKAANAFGVSSPSTEVVFNIGGLPGPPINLTASMSGARLTLAWGAPATGGAVTQYLATAGRAPLSSDIVADAPIGTATSFSIDLAPGQYYIRIRARNAAGVSGFSNEVSVAVGGSGTPGPPTGFDYTILGSLVQLRWSPPSTGGTPQGYRIQVGSASGLTNVLQQDLGNVTTMNVQAPVDGSFYIRILAYNSSGVSGPSNERVVTLYPSACNRGAFVSTLVWDTGATGQPYVDMDLHVVEPPNQEVYYGNRIGLTTQLDRDNTRGLGPENICSRQTDALGNTIAPSNGTYQVYVHAYGGGVWPTTARVTVRSWVGTPQETYRVIERVFTGPGGRQNIATVSYPSGTIQEVSGARSIAAGSDEDLAAPLILKLPEPQ